MQQIYLYVCICIHFRFQFLRELEQRRSLLTGMATSSEFPIIRLDSMHDWESWSNIFKIRAEPALMQIIENGTMAHFHPQPPIPLAPPKPVYQGTEAQIMVMEKTYNAARNAYLDACEDYLILKDIYDDERRLIRDLCTFIINTIKKEFLVYYCKGDDICVWYQELRAMFGGQY